MAWTTRVLTQFGRGFKADCVINQPLRVVAPSEDDASDEEAPTWMVEIGCRGLDPIT